MNTRHTVNDDLDTFFVWLHIFCFCLWLKQVCLHILNTQQPKAIAFGLVLNIPFHTDLIMLRDK